MLHYIINISGCIDMAYYRMFFLQQMHENGMTLFNIDEMEDLTDATMQIREDLDRNAFADSQYRVSVCISRNITEKTFPNHSDLRYMIQVFQQLINRVDPERVHLFFVDRVLDHITFDSEREKNKTLMDDGYAQEENEYLPVFGHFSTDVPFVESKLSIKRMIDSIPNIYTKAFYQDVEAGLIQLLTNEELLHPDNSQTPEKNNDLLMALKEEFNKHCNQTIQKMECTFLMLPNNDRHMTQSTIFQLVDYLSSTRNDFSEDEYKKHKNQFTLDRIASHLATFRLRIKRWKDGSSDKSLVLNVNRKEKNAHTADFLKDAIQHKQDMLMLFQSEITWDSLQNWEKTIETIDYDISLAESRLLNHVAEIVENYKDQKSETEPLSDTRIYQKKEELQEKRNKIVKKLGEQSEAENNSKFQKELGLRSYLSQNSARVKYLLECMKKYKRRMFLLCAGAALLCVILPYTVLQIYVFASPIRLMIYLGYIGLTATVFGLTYVIARKLFLREISRIIQAMKVQIDCYFVDYEKRITAFEQKLYDDIEELSEIEREYEQIHKWEEEKAAVGCEVQWHRRKISEIENTLVYFQDLIKKAQVLDEIKIEINYSKSDSDNPFYWPMYIGE